MYELYTLLERLSSRITLEDIEAVGGSGGLYRMQEAVQSIERLMYFSPAVAEALSLLVEQCEVLETPIPYAPTSLEV